MVSSLRDDAVSEPRILIIDDDRELGEMLAEFFVPEHFDVGTALSGEAGLAMLAEGDADIVILDIMLPGMSGIDVLKTLRQRSDVPVIMLTARGEDIDRILGLEFGADDYLSKPFNPRELLARIKAILRRSAGNDRGGTLSVGALTIDTASQRVTAGDASLTLTGAEFELLRRLAASPGDIVSKDVLSQDALGRRHMPYDRSIDTHISNLRKKLSAVGIDNPSIQSRRGFGYRLVEER